MKMSSTDPVADGSFWQISSSPLEIPGHAMDSLGFPDPSPLESDQNDGGCLMTGDSSTTGRKLTHNDCERDRRKKLNGLYSSLRSLLPDVDRQKKLTIPCTVSHVLQYIPELQKTIQRLKRRKEMLLRTRTEGNSKVHIANDRTHKSSYPVVSAVCVGDREVMVQICSLLSSGTMQCPLSKILTCLDAEGLQLIHASTSRIEADRVSYHLHLQAKDIINTEQQVLNEDLEKFVVELLGLGWNHITNSI